MTIIISNFNISKLFLGFYSRIDEYDTIREKVLSYVNVMARPMVMYQNDHPIHWTPPFVGGKVGIK